MRHRARSSRVVRLRDALLGIDVGVLFLFAAFCAVASWAIWVICASASG